MKHSSEDWDCTWQLMNIYWKPSAVLSTNKLINENQPALMGSQAEQESPLVMKLKGFLYLGKL